VRHSYKTIKQGGIARQCTLSKSDIKRLENAGFEWDLRGKTGSRNFDKRFKDLMAFKAEFGHCNVSQSKSSDNKHHPLGKWCCNVRQSYKNIKQGGISRQCTLSKSDIKRLENAGFEWVLRKTGSRNFDEHFKDLMAFKAEFGHCNVSQSKSSDKKHHPLGKWCSTVRQSYKTIKQGDIPPRCPLNKSDIKRLDNAGFEWDLRKAGRHSS